MKCCIMKWLISNSLDAQKEFSSVVKKHLASCSACRDFAAISDEIGISLAQDAEGTSAPAAACARIVSTPQIVFFGRTAIAMAGVACILIIAVTVILHESRKPNIGMITATADAALEYISASAVLAAPMKQYDTEIKAFGQVVDDMTEILIASAQVVSPDIITDIIF